MNDFSRSMPPLWQPGRLQALRRLRPSMDLHHRFQLTEFDVLQIIDDKHDTRGAHRLELVEIARNLTPIPTP